MDMCRHRQSVNILRNGINMDYYFPPEILNFEFERKEKRKRFKLNSMETRNLFLFLIIQITNY